MRDKALEKAIERAGGCAALARHVGISQAAVSQWDCIPLLRVRAVSDLTGIPPHKLRPDVFPTPKRTGKAA